MVYGLIRVKIVTNVKEFLPQNAPRVKALDRIDEIFGGIRFIIAAFCADNFFTYTVLNF